jgi:putative transposase
LRGGIQWRTWVRAIRGAEVTYYRWRKEFGGLKSNQVRKMKDIEAANRQLHRAVSDLTLDKMILAEAAWMCRPR